MLDAIKKDYLVLYFDRDMTIEDNAISLNEKDLELAHAFLYHRVGKYDVRISDNILSIGCKVFTIVLAKNLVRLQKDGVRTGNDDLIRIANSTRSN